VSRGYSVGLCHESSTPAAADLRAAVGKKLPPNDVRSGGSFP